MKNIEMILATKSISPMAIKKNAMKILINDACTGSLESAFPYPSQRLTKLFGNILSAPMACKVRGATRMEPSAEDSAAAAKPIGMIGPQYAILCMIS